MEVADNGRDLSSDGGGSANAGTSRLREATALATTVNLAIVINVPYSVLCRIPMRHHERLQGREGYDIHRFVGNGERCNKGLGCQRRTLRGFRSFASTIAFQLMQEDVKRALRSQSAEVQPTGRAPDE